MLYSVALLCVFGNGDGMLSTILGIVLTDTIALMQAKTRTKELAGFSASSPQKFQIESKCNKTFAYNQY